MSRSLTSISAAYLNEHLLKVTRHNGTWTTSLRRHSSPWQVWIIWTLIRQRNLSPPTLINGSQSTSSGPAVGTTAAAVTLQWTIQTCAAFLLRLHCDFWSKPSSALEATCFGLRNPTTSTFVHPSHSSATSFLPHSKCSDEVSCLLIYSMQTFWYQTPAARLAAPALVSGFLSLPQPPSHTVPNCWKCKRVCLWPDVRSYIWKG